MKLSLLQAVVTPVNFNFAEKKNIDYEPLTLNTLFFFYKNLVYKNIKASKGPKIKNILRTY